jgi:hypothetical protein
MQSRTLKERTSSIDDMGLTPSQRFQHEENRSRGKSIIAKMQDFLLQFDDYNYKMLNDDLRRIITFMKKDIE